MPQVWCYNMLSGLMQVSAEFYLPHLLKGSRGLSGSGRDHRQRQRDNWRQNERATQRRLWGRGELGWKDSGEQSEINLDTPDGLKFVCEHMNMCCCQLVHLGLCIGIYARLCVLRFFREI